MTSRPVVPPITLSSTFAFDTNAELADAVQAKAPHLYSRWSNPTVAAVEEAIAQLEGAARSVLVASGMAAVHLAILAALGESSGPLVVQNEVYGGTHELVRAVRWPSDVSVRRFALDDVLEVAAQLPAGAVLYLETPTNPLVRLVDVAAVRDACASGVRIVVDATFASPALSTPLAEGADLVLHSVTKAMAGHHDVVAGVVSGGEQLMAGVWRWRKILGPTLDPAASYRVWRGLQTLSLRVDRQSASAAELARRLAAHPSVVAVHHPSLPQHPDHELLQRTHRDGLGGGVLSFELSSAARASMVVNALDTIAVAPSLGGVHTLVTWPAGVTHANVSEDELNAAGVRPGLLRLAVGLEDPDALWNDLDSALGEP
ncbi:MAG: PLP-dependent transferase [Deltaproteobacteria bacterium]|nr:PLP-dependent transferase [Deltaproteobacteria bacterium]